MFGDSLFVVQVGERKVGISMDAQLPAGAQRSRRPHSGSRHLATFWPSPAALAIHPGPDIRLACLAGYDSRGTVCSSVFAVRCNSIAVITAFATEVSIAFCSSVICRGRVSNTHKEPITSPSCAFNGAPA